MTRLASGDATTRQELQPSEPPIGPVETISVMLCVEAPAIEQTPSASAMPSALTHGTNRIRLLTPPPPGGRIAATTQATATLRALQDERPGLGSRSSPPD